MHQHYGDMFEASEFGIRFRVYGRIDEIGGPATLATPAAAKAPAPAAPAAPAKAAPAISDLEAEKSAAKAVQPAATPVTPKAPTTQAQEAVAQLGTLPKAAATPPKAAAVPPAAVPAAPPAANPGPAQKPISPPHGTTSRDAPNTIHGGTTPASPAKPAPKISDLEAEKVATGATAKSELRGKVEQVATQPATPVNTSAREQAQSMLKNMDAATSAWMAPAAGTTGAAAPKVAAPAPTTTAELHRRLEEIVAKPDVPSNAVAREQAKTLLKKMDAATSAWMKH